MPAGQITFQMIDGDDAANHLGELRALYREVYAEPPYQWGDDHAGLFADRFEVQHRQDGFALVEARDGRELAGAAFGVTLRPSTPWWRDLTTALPAEVTTAAPRSPRRRPDCRPAPAVGSPGCGGRRSPSLPA